MSTLVNFSESTSSLIVDSGIKFNTFSSNFNQFNSAMLDLIELYIPFKSDLVTTVFSDDDVQFTSKLNLHATFFSDIGLKVMGWGIHKNCEGVIYADSYCISYESLPTSFTGIAYKVHLECINIIPYISIKFSPAKILQGHNVFGPISLKLGALEGLTHFQLARSELSELLDFKSARVAQLDVTVSAQLPNRDAVLEAIKILKNVHVGQTKARFSPYETTVGFGAFNSKHKRIKGYAKQDEFEAQLKELTRKARRGDKNAQLCVDVMSDPRLQDFVKNRFRLEVSLLKHFFEKEGVSDNLWELIKFQESNFLRKKCVFTDWWKIATADIFKSLEGEIMKINDLESVLDVLRQNYQTVTRTGNISYTKANHLYDFYKALRDDGVQSCKQRYGKNYFAKFKALTDVGFKPADLQNLKSFNDDPNRVHSVLNILNFDFANQRPSWYEEPISFFQKAA
jgi:II/X family phage/plasmid replication protein